MNNVILDLDNTLISAEAIEEFPFEQEGIKDKAIKFIIHNMENYYIIFERPFCQEFLTWLFENYNVSVWTAASKDYALFVIDKIILTNKKRKLNHILFSYHCSLSKKLYNGDPKNLKLIFDIFKIHNYNNKNSIIIDDLDLVYNPQPNNAINIKEFNILDSDSPDDTELVKIKDQIKEKFIELNHE